MPESSPSSDDDQDRIALPEETKTTPSVVHLRVTGMMCQRNCGTTVAAALRRLPDAVASGAVFDERRAWVEFAAAADDDDGRDHQDHDAERERRRQVAAAVRAVEDVGFEATVMLSSSPPDRIVHFRVDGMMCQRNCGTTVANALRAVPGVVDARAVFAERRAWIQLGNDDDDDSENSAVVTEAAVEAVEDVGFDASRISDLPEYLAQLTPPSSPARDVTASQTSSSDSADHLERGLLLGDSNGDGDGDDDDENGGATFHLAIQGMSCAVCTGRVVRETCREE